MSLTICLGRYRRAVVSPWQTHQQKCLIMLPKGRYEIEKEYKPLGYFHPSLCVPWTLQSNCEMSQTHKNVLVKVLLFCTRLFRWVTKMTAISRGKTKRQFNLPWSYYLKLNHDVSVSVLEIENGEMRWAGKMFCKKAQNNCGRHPKKFWLCKCRLGLEMGFALLASK